MVTGACAVLSRFVFRLLPENQFACVRIVLRSMVTMRIADDPDGTVLSQYFNVAGHWVLG